MSYLYQSFQYNIHKIINPLHFWILLVVTHKERMLAALRGQNCDELPWAPRLALWYRANKRAQTLQLAGVDTYQLPYGGMLDLYTPFRIKQLASLKQPDIVMSWMNRASKMTPVGKWINVGRLGGYYNLKYYKNCDYLICNTPDICNYVIKQGWPEKNTPAGSY